MISIILTVHDKEWLIKRVTKSIVDNTTLDAELIVVFDGCKDNSEGIIDSIDKKNIKYKKFYAPDVFETKANNIGIKNSEGEFVIVIQDDMVINEYGWDKKLLEPFKFEDVFAVSARAAHNYGPRGYSLENVTDYIDRYKGAKRDIFYIRNSVNRGPLAFRKIMLEQLNYLDEIYAPYTWDEHDICYRAYKENQWVSGLYMIDYISDRNWGTTRTKNGLIFITSYSKNANIFYNRHSDIINGKNHNEERKI
jgi:glycosyltransferase involved in cell wall biosynthesis